MSLLGGTSGRVIELSLAIVGVAMLVAWFAVIAFVFSQGGTQIAGAMAVITAVVAVVYYLNEMRE